MTNDKSDLSANELLALQQMEDLFREYGLNTQKLGRLLVLNQHRTHQQSTVRNVLALLMGVSKGMIEMSGSDGRNEKSKEFCEEFLKWLNTISYVMPYM